MEDKKLENIIDKNLGEEKEIPINSVKMMEDIELLKQKIEQLEKQVTYQDANLKANYILPLMTLVFLIFSILFEFDVLTKISNINLTIGFAIGFALFFYKENKHIVTLIMKKIFIKG